MLKVLDVDGAVRRVSGGWVATGQAWEYDGERYARVAADRSAEQQAMRAYAGTTECRMQFLRRQLDDPDAAPCGRCDNCTGRPMPADVSPGSLSAAQTALGRPGVEIEPRRMWPTGLVALGLDLSGRIPPELQADSGRALGRLSDVGWGSRLRDVFAGPDAEVPDDVLRAVVQVLAGWGWEERPAGIVALPSRARPLLVESLASRLAQVGRLPLLGTLVRTHDDARRSGSNSAQRLLAVHRSLAVPPDLRLDGSPVLLVDDRLDTGWTMTEATRLLREGGAGHVLPLALAVAA
jgi:ATP-dependent DNA helicase RecQ